MYSVCFLHPVFVFNAYNGAGLYKYAFEEEMPQTFKVVSNYTFIDGLPKNAMASKYGAV